MDCFNFAASFSALKFGSALTVPKYAVSVAPLEPCDKTFRKYYNIRSWANY